MGIIDQYKRKHHKEAYYKTKKPTGERSELPKILDLSYLKELAKKVLTHHLTTEDGLESYRKHQYIWTINLQNILGKVNDPQWVFMVESHIEWLIENWTAVQPNGKWKLSGFEIAIEVRDQSRPRTVGRDKDGRPDVIDVVTSKQYMVVGFELTDVLGKLDLVYEMGRPKVRTDGGGLDAKTLRDVLASSQKSGDSSAANAKLAEQSVQLAEQQHQIAKLQEQLSKTNEIMGSLLAEMSSKSPKRGSKK